MVNTRSHQQNKSIRIISKKMSQFEELIKKAYDVKVEKVGRKNVSLNIRWLDVKGVIQSDNVTIREGDHIEF